MLQLVAGGGGADFDHLDGLHGDAGVAHGGAGALNLRSARALSAGLAFFGLGGLAGLSLGLGWLSFLPAVALGLGAMVVTQTLLRGLVRFDQDRSVVLDHAIGERGKVYLSVPAARSGLGKVHVTIQDRILECAAVTPDEAIPTGSPVLIVDIEPPDTLVVVHNPQLLEENHESL